MQTLEQLKAEFLEVNPTRAKNDYYGNPRYIIHYTHFAYVLEKVQNKRVSYDDVRKALKGTGFKVYRGVDYGGGFVTQSYNIKQDLEYIFNKLTQQSK